MHTLKQLRDAAVTALNRGDLRRLQQYCQAILQRDSQQPDAHFFLSIVAAAGGQLRKAIERVDSALAIQPGDSEYLSQKARYHAQLNEYRPAIAAADAALAAGPQRALVLDTLGVVYSKFDQHHKAAQALREAVAKSPGNAQFQFNLASAEQFLGRREAARSAYESAIALRPGFARAHWALSELEKNQADSARRQTLEALLRNPALGSEDQLYLSHALAREYERQQDYAEAFSCLERAKARQRKKIGYSFSRDEQIFAAMKKAFPLQNLPQSQGDAPGSELIFVLGMPRSGTTLVERILNAHTQVCSLGELQEFPLALKRCSGDRSPRVLDEQVIAAAAQKGCKNIGADYLEQLQARGRGEQRLIDKLPMNFLYIGFILQSLPGARVVCLERDPLDTCLSNYRQLFSFNFHYYNYHYSLADSARYICAFTDLMQHWKRLYGERIYTVNYEALTAAPEREAGALMRYLRLDWQAGCLEFHKSAGAVSTASTMQVRQPIYRSAVQRWRKYEKQLAPAVEIFRERGLI